MTKVSLGSPALFSDPSGAWGTAETEERKGSWLQVISLCFKHGTSVFVGLGTGDIKNELEIQTTRHKIDKQQGFTV